MTAVHRGRGQYRPDAEGLADAAFSDAWTPTHAQLIALIIEVAHSLGWLVTVTHDSRTDHWGADSGWPDVFAVPDPTIVSRRGHAVAIEVKVPPDDLTAEQRAWWVALAAVPGIDSVVFRSSGYRGRDMAAIAELLQR